MAREILFKAKRLDTGEWAEGSLLFDGKDNYYIGTIIFPKKSTIIAGGGRSKGKTLNRFKSIGFVQVDHKTICKYTGLTDKNGNKIWENDIVGYWDTYSTDNGYSEADCIGKVIWDDETLSFQVTERLSAESYEVLYECSVFGNIFDNQELLWWEKENE